MPAVFVNGLSVWCADSKIYSAQISILDISSQSKPSYAGMHFPWNGLLESFLYSPASAVTYRERSSRDGHRLESVAGLGNVCVTELTAHPVGRTKM